VRLGTCIALEIVAAVSAIGGLSLGTAYAVGELRDQVGGPRSQAVAARTAPAPAPVAPAPVAPPGPTLAITPAIVPPAPEVAVAVDAGVADAAPVAPALAAVEGAIWEFVGVSDHTLLDPIRTGKLTRVRFNRGGSTLSLRLEFDNGARAAFKPDQVILQLPRREIAAYRLDRLLGVGRVPPAIGRSFTMAELEEALDPSQRGMAPRLRREAVARKGRVHGEASWWIPVIKDIRIGGAKLDETDAIVTWRKWLRVGAAIPPDRLSLAQQLSTMTLFDFLTDNIDRWSGNNAKSSEDGTVLYFMDNTMSFGRSPRGNHRTRTYLERCQVFSRRLVNRLRAVDEAAIRAVMAHDPGPYEEVLTSVEIEALLGRRTLALAYIDGLIEKHGEEKVLVFP